MQIKAFIFLTVFYLCVKNTLAGHFNFNLACPKFRVANCKLQDPVIIHDSILKKMLKQSALVCKAKLLRMGLYVVWDWGTAEATHNFKVISYLDGNSADTISTLHLCYYLKDTACLSFLKYNKEYILFLNNKRQRKEQINSPGFVSFYDYEHYNVVRADFGILDNTLNLEEKIMELIKKERLQK